MDIKKIVFIIESEKDKNISKFLESIKEEKKSKLTTFTLNENIKFNGAKFLSEDIIQTVEKIMEIENPDLIVLHKEKIDPFKRLFLKPEYVKLSEKFRNQKFLFLEENIEKIEKVGVVIDFEEEADFAEFLKNAYQLSNFFNGEPDYIYSFYEEYYEMALMKTHTEREAKDIINTMKNEKIEKLKESLAKALEGKPAKLKILNGDPKKHIPYYLHENKFDLAVLSYNLHNKTHYVENIETSIALI